MDQTTLVYDKLLAKIIDWAEEEEDIRSAVLIGSRARVVYPADESSDLDIILFSTCPQYYLSSAGWVERIGQSRLSFIEPTSEGGFYERRVLFEGGYDVDFAFLPIEVIQQAIQTGIPPEMAQILKRGARLVLDKDGLIARLDAVVIEAPQGKPPSQEEYLNLVNDFWYHAVWTAKKIHRGELWTAKMCSDNYMKWRLLRMIEWYARTTRGWDLDTWHGGRFLERWADPSVIEGLRLAFSSYDEKDLWRGLFVTMDLFRQLAVETAGPLGFSYPVSGDECATILVKEIQCKASS